MLPATKVCYLVFALALVLCACATIRPVAIQPAITDPAPTRPAAGPATEGQPTAQEPALPNPASVFCEEQGGRVEIRTDASGGQSGVCIFEDGSECDEWAFYRGECQPREAQPAASPVPGPRYVNDVYGFSFDAPSEWSIEEFADYLLFTRPGYKLFVGYQRANEAAKPFRTGMPQGDLVEGGSASLLGQPIPRKILVSEGKNKVISYGGRIKAGDLILVMYLDAVGAPEVSYDQLNIPAEMIAEADRIIASFALASGETPQLEFNLPTPDG